MDSEVLIYYENTYPIIDSEFLKYNVEVKYVKSWEEVRNLKTDGILCSQIPPLDIDRNVPIALFRHYELLDEPLIQCVPDLGNVMSRICSDLIRKKVRKIHVSANPDCNRSPRTGKRKAGAIRSCGTAPADDRMELRMLRFYQERRGSSNRFTKCSGRPGTHQTPFSGSRSAFTSRMLQVRSSSSMQFVCSRAFASV